MATWLTAEAASVLSLLAGATWKATLLIVVLLGVARLTSGAAAATRHVLWSVGLVAIVALPLLGAAVPWELDLLPASGLDVPAAETNTTSPPRTGTEPSSATGAASSAGRVENTEPPWSGAGAWFLASVWLAGAGLMILRLTVGWIGAVRIVQEGRRLDEGPWSDELARAAERVRPGRFVDLVMSDREHVPFTTGILRPTIVLPRSAREWDRERRRVVLLHELAHVRRRDLVLHALARLVRSLHWFNPFVWHLARRLHAESERACDDLVLGSGIRASRYAEHLLEMARSSPTRAVPAIGLAMVGETDFESRVSAVLEPSLPRRATASAPVTAAVVAAMTVAVFPLAALGAANPTQADSGPEGARADRDAQAYEGAVDVLLKTLGTDEHPEVREAAAWSLGELENPRAIDGLTQAANDPTTAVRLAAVWALQEMEDERAAPALLRALEDASADIRLMGALGLSELDLEEPPAELVAATSDPDPRVRRMATLALGEGR